MAAGRNFVSVPFSRALERSLLQEVLVLVLQLLGWLKYMQSLLAPEHLGFGPDIRDAQSRGFFRKKPD